MTITVPIAHSQLETAEGVEKILRDILIQSSLDPTAVVFTIDDCSSPERLERVIRQFILAVSPHPVIPFNSTELHDPYMLERVLRRLELVLP